LVGQSVPPPEPQSASGRSGAPAGGQSSPPPEARAGAGMQSPIPPANAQSLAPDLNIPQQSANPARWARVRSSLRRGFSARMAGIASGALGIYGFKNFADYMDQMQIDWESGNVFQQGSGAVIMTSNLTVGTLGLAGMPKNFFGVGPAARAIAGRIAIPL